MRSLIKYITISRTTRLLEEYDQIYILCRELVYRLEHFPVSRLFFSLFSSLFSSLYASEDALDDQFVHKLVIFFQFSSLFEELLKLLKFDESYQSSKVTVSTLWIRSELIGYPISMQIKRHSHKTVSLKVEVSSVWNLY